MKTDNNKKRRKRLKKLKKKIRRLKWFPCYQSFDELGIKGRRNENERYRHLDFSLCKDKIVVDYGCNLGQASVKAARAGARRVIGVDCQQDTIEAANEIKEFLDIPNLEYHVLDFNDENYKKKLVRLFNREIPDIAFFLSVYRTKELKDRDDLFNFIIKNTREIIFFEGHSSKSIDTVDYYTELFYKFKINAEFLGYSQRNTRPFFLIKLK